MGSCIYYYNTQAQLQPKLSELIVIAMQQDGYLNACLTSAAEFIDNVHCVVVQIAYSKNVCCAFCSQELDDFKDSATHVASHKLWNLVA